MHRLLCALVLAVLSACATGGHVPSSTAALPAKSILVLEPVNDGAGAQVDLKRLYPEIVAAATAQAKGFHVVTRQEMAERGVRAPKLDRAGEAAMEIGKSMGVALVLFGVAGQAQATGPGMVLVLVTPQGDRAGEWMKGGTEELTKEIPREVGALLQDLGVSATEPVSYSSGLVMEVTDPGNGPRARLSDHVKVNYEGKLEDGTVFDSSIRRGQPAVFPLTGVIQCWQEAVAKLHVGAKARLVCPPAIAYGERGSPPAIPPKATLSFEVELLGIEK